MVPILSIYIYRNTHTKTGKKRERLGKQRKEKPKAEKQWKERKRHREASHGGDLLFSACSGSPGPPPPPTGRTTWEQSPGSQAGRPRKSSPAELQGATPRSSGHPAHPPASSPSHLPSPRPATYFWSTPAGRAPAGRAGRRPRPRAWWQLPLARSAFTSTRPCQPPTRRRRVWNPLLAQRLPARLPAIGSDAPPSAPQGSAAGWRRGRARQEGAGGTARKEPGGPLGAGSAQVMGSSGGRVRARGGAGFPVGAAWGGSGARASRS